MRSILFVTAVAAVACSGLPTSDGGITVTDAGDGGGSTGQGTATVSGPLGFTVTEARRILNRQFSDGGLDSSWRAQVIMFARPFTDYCEGIGPPGTYDAFVVDVVIRDGGQIRPGTYSVGYNSGDQDGQAWWVRITLDGGPFTSGTQLFQFADGGTVTFTRLDDERVVGSFDTHVPFTDGGAATMSGTFDVPPLLCE